MNRSIAIVLALVVTSMLVVSSGCSGDTGDDDSSSSPSPTLAPTPTPTPTPAPTPTPLPDCSSVCAPLSGSAVEGDGMGRALYVVPCASSGELPYVFNDALSFVTMIWADPSMETVRQSWIDSGMWTPDDPQAVYLWETATMADRCRLTSPEYGDAPLMGTNVVMIQWITVGTTLTSDINSGDDDASWTNEDQDTATSSTFEYPIWNLCDDSIGIQALEPVLMYEWLNPPAQSTARSF